MAGTNDTFIGDYRHDSQGRRIVRAVVEDVGIGLGGVAGTGVRASDGVEELVFEMPRIDVLESGRLATQYRDVREWASGFTGTDAAQNTAALRGMAAIVKAAGGGVLRIPFADFPVDCTTNVPLENSPGSTVVYEGLTVNSLGSTALGTRIRRASGTLDVLSWVGTGNNGSARCHGGLRHIELDGGGVNARIANFSRCNELELPFLRVIGGPTDNTDYGGIEFQQVWNTFAGTLLMYRCGGATFPAVVVKGLLADPLPACDSIHWDKAKWEACKGIMYQVQAPGGGNVHATQFFGQINLESQLSGQTAKVFDVLDCELTIGSLAAKLSPAGGTSVFWTQDSSDGVAIPRTHIGSLRLQHGGSAVSHFVEIVRGTFLWAQAEMIGTPATGTAKYLKIGASVGPGTVGPRKPLVSAPTLLVSDSRAYGSIEPFGTRSIPCRMVASTGSGGEVAIASGDVAGIDMSGAADSAILFRAPVPADAMAEGAYSVRVRWTIDGAAGTGGNNTVRLGGKVHQVASGALVTGGTATFTTQSVVVPTVNAVRETYFGVGNVTTRGDEIMGRLNRLASSDAVDDYTSRLVVIGIDLISMAVSG